MWPFAKLLNGFGSHRCIYSPILLDSQELSTFYLSTPTSAHACDASPVTTIPTKLRWSAMEWRCVRPAQLPWQLQVQLLKITMVTGLSPMDNGNADWHATWFLLHVPVLILCLWDGGFLQWGMENVVLDRRPRCGRRWQRPAFTSVFGGQCANGGDNGGRKDTDQPLSEDLMHNKTSSALSCMAKMPRFLKGA